MERFRSEQFKRLILFGIPAFSKDRLFNQVICDMVKDGCLDKSDLTVLVPLCLEFYSVFRCVGNPYRGTVNCLNRMAIPEYGIGAEAAQVQVGKIQ